MCVCKFRVMAGRRGEILSTVFPLSHFLLSHRVGGFVLLMTPSRYDLIQFVLSNWWHIDSLGWWGRGSHALGRPSHCKHSSPTNKVLLLMSNGNERAVHVRVFVRLGREKYIEDNVVKSYEDNWHVTTAEPQHGGKWQWWKPQYASTRDI